MTICETNRQITLFDIPKTLATFLDAFDGFPPAITAFGVRSELLQFGFPCVYSVFGNKLKISHFGRIDGRCSESNTVKQQNKKKTKEGTGKRHFDFVSFN